MGAVMLAATLVAVEHGRSVVAEVSRTAAGRSDLVIAAARRLERGRVITVVG